MDDEEAEEVCRWWRSHFEFVNDGYGIQCTEPITVYIPSGGLEGCIESRTTLFGPDSECHIRVQRFYDCIASMPNYRDVRNPLPEPCRLPESCVSRLQP